MNTKKNIEEPIQNKQPTIKNTGKITRNNSGSTAVNTEKEKNSKKFCLICKKIKDVSEFYFIRSETLKLDSYCKECRKRTNRRWNKNNKQRKRELTHIWRQENPERYHEINAQYRKRKNWNLYLREYRKRKKNGGSRGKRKNSI